MVAVKPKEVHSSPANEGLMKRADLTLPPITPYPSFCVSPRVDMSILRHSTRGGTFSGPTITTENTRDTDNEMYFSMSLLQKYIKSGRSEEPKRAFKHRPPLKDKSVFTDKYNSIVKSDRDLEAHITLQKVKGHWRQPIAQFKKQIKPCVKTENGAAYLPLIHREGKRIFEMIQDAFKSPDVDSERRAFSMKDTHAALVYVRNKDRLERWRNIVYGSKDSMPKLSNPDDSDDGTLNLFTNETEENSRMGSKYAILPPVKYSRPLREHDIPSASGVSHDNKMNDGKYSNKEDIQQWVKSVSSD